MNNRAIQTPSRVAKLMLVAAVTALAACSTTSPDVISRDEAQRFSRVDDATVLNVRPVVVEGQQSGIGAVTGGVVGGLGGASVGGRREQAAVGVVGAVAGAVVGNAIERFGTRESAVEILVQMPSGERRSIVQAEGDEKFSPGDAVLLIASGGKTRVIKAPRVTRQTTAPK